MIGRPSRSIVGVGVMIAALLSTALPVGVAAQEEPTSQSVQIEVAATTATGPSGLAVLTATEGGTGVQVMVPGAPESTVATIQPGTCASIGTELVGLLGQLGAGGQAQATVPLPISTLADGKHVIALHPGIDLGTTIACGVIPALALGVEEPTLAGDCTGVPAWVTLATQRLDRGAEMSKAADAVDLDLNLYLNALASNIGEGQAMIEMMRVEQVPAAATEVHQQMLAALQLAVDSAQLFLDALMSGSDVSAYQEAMTKAKQAQEDLIKVRSAVAGLKAKCPG